MQSECKKKKNRLKNSVRGLEKSLALGFDLWVYGSKEDYLIFFFVLSSDSAKK